jgi:hypothetical protein
VSKAALGRRPVRLRNQITEIVNITTLLLFIPIHIEMPFHPDDGNAFFQLARTVIQQAGFALEIDMEEPDRLLTHYDRVTHLLQRFIQLSNIYHQNNTIAAWIQAIIQTQHRIRYYLELL